MPGKRKKPDAPSVHDRLADLAELAGKLNLPDDAFDGDLRDACDDEADMMYEDISEGVMLAKLEFLYMHGYELGRLHQLVVEASGETDENGGG